MDLLFQYRTREITVYPSGFQQKVRFNHNSYIQYKIQNILNYYDLMRYQLLADLWRFVMIEISQIEEDKAKIPQIIYAIKQDIIENLSVSYSSNNNHSASRSSEEELIENTPIKRDHYYCIKDMIYFYLTMFRMLNIEIYDLNDFPVYENTRSFAVYLYISLFISIFF